MPAWVITGGAGMIGSMICRHLELHQKRPELVVVDSVQCPEQWGNLARRRIARRIDKDALPEWLAVGPAVEAVVHMGAISDTAVREPGRLVADNFRYSQMLWRWCAEHGVPFFYASSAATYGDGSAGFSDSTDLSVLKPLNGYARSKHLFDRWVFRQVAIGAPCPPRWAGFKFFNVYGPNEYHKGRMASIAWQAARQVADSGSVRLFFVRDDKGERVEARRDFVHVEDAAAVVCHFLSKPAPSGIYNVGSGHARGFSEVATAVMAAMGRQPSIEWVPLPEEFRGRYQMLTEAPIGRLRSAGYARPMREIEDGVGDYVRRYLMSAEPYA